MPRLNFVKKARKDNPVAGVKKGESYYWASFRVGRGSFKKFWKERPPRSQLTLSDFLSQIYDLEDRGFSGESPEDLATERDGMVSDLNQLADECEDKRSNMPESLQYSPTGGLLQARVDGLQSTASEFENVDLDYDEPDEDEVIASIREKLAWVPDGNPNVEITPEGIQAEREAMLAEWCEDKRMELEDIGFEYE